MVGGHGTGPGGVPATDTLTPPRHPKGEEEPMTLDTTLLQRLADWRPGGGPQALDVVDPGSGWAVSITAECVDQVGCRLRELEFRPPGGQTAGDLAGRAGRVASRVTSLLEPLKILEVDAVGDTALLRSDAPGTWGGDLCYYEVLLRGRRSRHQNKSPHSPESCRRASRHLRQFSQEDCRSFHNFPGVASSRKP
jgi:hypothetical protein